jgi:prevent-host-death family protein
MKPARITATEAARTFSDLVARVRYRGEEYIVEKNGEPVCRIVPIEVPRKGTGVDLLRILREFPLDEDFAEDVRKGIPEARVPESPWDR